MAKSKSDLAILIAGLKPKGKPDDAGDDEKAEPEAPEEESGKGMAFDTAAQEAFDALKGDDVDSFKKALKAAVESC